MQFGERQVETSLDKIRRDHVARYEWAAKQIPDNNDVIDLACGIGYGANIMAKAGHNVLAVDRCGEALAYGAEHWHHDRIDFAQLDAETLNGGAIGEFDTAVCFETVEHLQDPAPLLRSLRASADLLLVSVPNEDVIPWKRVEGNTTITTAFHHRHYTPAQFEELLNQCGWEVAEWYGQEGAESEVERGMMGRTIIAKCEHGKISVQPEKHEEKHITILGLGPSLDQYIEQTKRVGGKSRFCDETWAINALGDVFACDLVFHMDDVRIQEIRAAARPDSNIAAMLKWIKTSATPVVTSRMHPDYPALVEFPLEDVLNNLGHDYFNNTGAYAVAFAIHVGATKISLFGLDYTYPNAHDAERGRACVEFWLGQAHARGIEIKLPKTTTLMDSMYPQASRLYGYDTLDIKLDMQDSGLVKVNATERTELPTADEIEANYDHSKPIEKQHMGKAS